MERRNPEWDLELEESAQGADSFTAPGREVQLDEAREASREWSAGSEPEASAGSPRVETARTRRHLLGDALNDLELALAAPSASEGWVDRVAAALHRLRRSLAEHIEVTEGPDGLLEEIRELAPRLSNEIALIEAEHEALTEMLERAEASLGQSNDPKAIRNRALAILPRLSLHRQRGADLVYDAYNVDIATGD